jgi:hypothetical protein
MAALSAQPMAESEKTMPVPNRDHYAFSDKFALAVMRTVTNPAAPVRDITGSYTALKTAFKNLGV